MSVMTTAPRDSLRTLRLSGMLETLDARLIQAPKGGLGHLDFLRVLCRTRPFRLDHLVDQRKMPATCSPAK